jgi:hypothetical protein
MFRWLSIALLAAIICVPLSSAQMHGGRGFSVSRSGGFHHGAHRFAGGGFLASPFFYPDYDSGEPYPVEQAPPQVVFMQPAAVDDSPKKTKLAPLLIEWRGDHYVRFGGAQEADHEAEGQATSAHLSANPDYAERKTTKPFADLNESLAAKTRDLPPAVLIFRDGHTEEVSDYAIANGMIYVQGKYWQTGQAAEPIALSALDPVATIAANRQRGVTFMLPSASNVVIASF